MPEVALFLDDAEAKKWLSKLEKKVKSVAGGVDAYANIVSPIVFQDIISHFEEEEGSGGPWKVWSEAYTEHMVKIGRGGNQILQDSGRLKQAFTPAKFRKVSEGVLWYNPAKTKGGFPYAAGHQEGGDKLPKRDFMFLSEKAMDKIEKITLDWILED